ncbi:PREDICTED: uncharacterized protein K02A2.6-like, partial [Vollenhovia emeryi]|uniref:uncharacterized protein K02A2.6-like n=1 Tax=Vollenhovia emeryi TaxID=411798 RepID=UPI0005F509D0
LSGKPLDYTRFYHAGGAILHTYGTSQGGIGSNPRSSSRNRKCRARARCSVWWPRISAELQQLVDSCNTCIQNRPGRSEPLKPSNFPDRPWQIIAMDLFKQGTQWYLLVADFYSRYPEVYPLPNLRSSTIINKLKEIFAHHGIPEVIRSDNGTQFDPLKTTEFQIFKKTYGFEHRTSSPHFPQSNGFIEAMVRTVKNGLEKTKELDKWLMEYRATPLKCGFSPSELAMGRRIRSFLPMTPSLLTPKTVDRETLLSREKERIRRQKEDYDRRHHRTERDDLEEGDKVWIRDARRWGVVEKRADQPRSFWVQTEMGRLRRNRSHLHRLDAPLGYFETINNTPVAEEWYTPPQSPIRPNSPSADGGQRGRMPPALEEKTKDTPEAGETPGTSHTRERPKRVRKEVSRLNYDRLGGGRKSPPGAKPKRGDVA